jgi:flagellar hook-associated protein 3 FlgL
MRVTSDMMMRGMLRNLSNNMEKLDRYNTQLGTGKRVRRPSDDPAVTSLQMRLRSELRRMEQYSENTVAGKTWLENTDDALAEVGTVVHRLRDLAVQGGNGALAQESRDALAVEVDQLIDHLIHVGNSKVGGRYIFSGTRTMVAPLEKVYGADGRVSGVQYKGDDGSIEYEISSNVTVGINVRASDVLTYAIDAAISLRDRLLAGDTTAVGTDSLNELDAATDIVLRQRSIVGAKVNRLELTESRLGEMDANAQQLLTNVEDIDVAELVMKLRMQEAVYEASLNVGARIIQPSLLDFMK